MVSFTCNRLPCGTTNNFPLLPATLVGFVQAEYVVSDNDGQVDVCVEFKGGCLNGVEVVLQLTTSAGTAGNVLLLYHHTLMMHSIAGIGENDYTDVNETRTLDSCEEVCVPITVHDQPDLQKNREPYFNVELKLISSTERVSLFPKQSKVIVRDDTSKYIQDEVKKTTSNI